MFNVTNILKWQGHNVNATIVNNAVHLLWIRMHNISVTMLIRGGNHKELLSDYFSTSRKRTIILDTLSVTSHCQSVVMALGLFLDAYDQK